MTRKTTLLTVPLLLAVFAATSALAGGATRAENALWGGGILWDTILTPTSFRQPPSHSVDLLYDFSMSGLSGQRGVSSDVPGDPDYNGGRWWVQMVVFTEQGLEVHDPDGDGVVNFELTSAEEIADHITLGHIEVFETATYFECPLLPSN